jgi:hypothetical protein
MKLLKTENGRFLDVSMDFNEFDSKLLRQIQKYETVEYWKNTDDQNGLMQSQKCKINMENDLVGCQ